MRIFHSLGHVVGGTLLITGTTIGVGMLALPVATGSAGFVPSLVTYLICWAFMLCTGLLLLEVCIWMPKEANLITMVSRLLGPWGKVTCWIVYLFLFLTIMVAHVLGGGSVVTEFSGGLIPNWLSMLLYVAVFAPVIYLGAHSVDRLNIVLLSGVAISYILFIMISYTHVNVDLLKHSDWSKTFLALPILFTAFTYQLIIPTLMNYMERNVKKVRTAIIIGSTIPLVIYLIWEFLILGIIPVEGPNGLLEAANEGHTAIIPLKYLLDSPLVFTVGKYFAFFTLTASFIALALAFFDFLADGLKIKKTGISKAFLCFMMFLVPTVISFILPSFFLTALRYAGGISIAMLFGVFPPLMVWVGRYRKKYKEQHHMLPGGKPLLGILLSLVIIEMLMDLILQF